MQAITLGRFGGREVLRMSRVSLPSLRPAEVLVRVKAVGVNRGDIVQREGRYPPPPGASDLLGLEFAGEVAESRFGWKQGDRVMGILPGGGYAQFAGVHNEHLVGVPEGMDWSTAGALPEVWMTALQLTAWIARVQPGERVLLHAGASGVGVALIQLVKAAGAEGFATCGSEAKVQACLAYSYIDWAPPRPATTRPPTSVTGCSQALTSFSTLSSLPTSPRISLLSGRKLAGWCMDS